MADPVSTQRDSWLALRTLTPARVSLGRAGAALPTDAALQLALAHARARDAVHAAFDIEFLTCELADRGLSSLTVQSCAMSRDVYLRRPDLGRRLGDACANVLREAAPCDIAIVIGDGLSPTAPVSYAVDLAASVVAHPSMQDLVFAPIVIAQGARVALGDEIGECLAARLLIMLIGERPGMSTPDSLGIYVTYEPRIGRSDAERNCISNVHDKGLSISSACERLVWLVQAALSRNLTGIALKDESTVPSVERLLDR